MKTDSPSTKLTETEEIEALTKEIDQINSERQFFWKLQWNADTKEDVTRVYDDLSARVSLLIKRRLVLEKKFLPQFVYP